MVDKQVVATERVRLEKDVIDEEREVSETVAKKQIEVDGAEEDARRYSATCSVRAPP